MAQALLLLGLVEPVVCDFHVLQEAEDSVKCSHQKIIRLLSLPLGSRKLLSIGKVTQQPKTL